MDVEDVLPTIGKPRCAVCLMPVYLFAMQIVDSRVIFTASCHGEEQQVVFTLEEFEAIDELDFGLAFANPYYQPTH
jgi:hypothetical protein